jgi:hypothetical protein
MAPMGVNDMQVSLKRRAKLHIDTKKTKRDINCIRLYRSCYIDPLKCGTWALTWELALAWDSTVLSITAYTYNNLYEPARSYLVTNAHVHAHVNRQSFL